VLETHPTNTVHQTRSLNGTSEGDAIFHVPSDYHTASILCLQFDKEIMVTGSSDHSCIVWDIKTFEPIRRLLHHAAGVLDVCMDDQYIISCSKDAHICVWDRKTFTLIKALHGHRGPVNAVQLREINGKKLLVSASGDGLAKIWDLQKLDVIKQFNSQDRGLAAVEFSDDGKHVLAGGNDQVIYKFDVKTCELVHTFRGHSSLVRSLFLDSANGRVVSGSYDQGIRVYDFNQGELIGSYDNWTTSWILAAKGDYRRIVATSQDGRALLMDFGWGVTDVDLLSGRTSLTTLPDLSIYNGSSAGL
jgi:F-box and WD-40 domain protein 1/11